MLGMIEQFEGTADAYNQAWQKQYQELLKNLSETYKLLKTLEKQDEELMATIAELNSELTELRTKSEEMDNKIENLRARKEESTSKIQELNNDIEKLITESKKPQFELDNLTSKVDALNEKISTKEKEKGELDQKKINNENKEQELTTEHATRMEELEKKLGKLKQEHFFPIFIVENSPEDISEVEIISMIMTKGSVQLDDLKKSLDIPPIMAVRTIKQLAIKGLINLNEDTNEISMH